MKVFGIFSACLVLATQTYAFSLLGPYKPWMTEALAYRQPGDIGGPMSLGETYRWNLPTITYGFDESFLNYFGEEGARAVEDAFAILNDLPPMSQIDLNAYPTNSTTSWNHKAWDLAYRDLKSHTLTLLLNQLGLAEPSRFTFTMRARETNASGTNHLVIRLNYDPFTFQPATNVNGSAYKYDVVEIPNPLRTEAIESTVEWLGSGWTAVADRNLDRGSFYTGLTRDDVGGLRWLLRTNNVATETLPAAASLAPSPTGSGFIASPPYFPGFTNPITNVVYTAPRPGRDKLSFVRLPWDTNLQQFVPLTNVFVDAYYTNGRQRQQTLQRIITRPDILFRARDLGGDSKYVPHGPGLYSYTFVPRLVQVSDTSRWINHDDINGSSIMGGPGVIPPGATIDFGTPGRYLGLGHPDVVGAIDQWASFNDETNAPVAFLGPERATTHTISAGILDHGGSTMFEWTALGILDAVYRIDSTTDLVNWFTVTTITNVEGHFVFSAPVTTPQRFYRAIRQ